MKYLLIVLCFLIGCSESSKPSQHDIDEEVYKMHNLEKKCQEVAKKAGTNYSLEFPYQYEHGHYVCNLIDHKRHIFASFFQVELDAIKTFLIIKDQENE